MVHVLHRTDSPWGLVRCVRVCVWGGCVWVLSFSSVFVSLSVYLSSVCVCVCVCVQSGGG